MRGASTLKRDPKWHPTPALRRAHDPTPPQTLARQSRQGRQSRQSRQSGLLTTGVRGMIKMMVKGTKLRMSRTVRRSACTSRGFSVPPAAERSGFSVMAQRDGWDSA